MAEQWLLATLTARLVGRISSRFSSPTKFSISHLGKACTTYWTTSTSWMKSKTFFKLFLNWTCTIRQSQLPLDNNLPYHAGNTNAYSAITHSKLTLGPSFLPCNERSDRFLSATVSFDQLSFPFTAATSRTHCR